MVVSEHDGAELFRFGHEKSTDTRLIESPIESPVANAAKITDFSIPIYYNIMFDKYIISNL